jgi:hypothetical protein
VLRRPDTPSVRADLVSLTDAVEIELFQNDQFHRRWRFLTDTAARRWAARLAKRLSRRNFSDRRTSDRPKSWTE